MNTAIQKGATGGARRNNTRASSQKVADHHDKRASFKPVAVSGISAGEFITVKPAMFSKLDVDPSYQRGETTMVNQIVRALQAGGAVLDPVTLCERRDNGKYWIVDGYQRVCAFQQLGIPFTAMLHQSDSAEAEKTFFIALNSKRALSANVIVKAWTGPSGSLMRKANESLEHPLYDRINFTQSSNDARMSASSLSRALLTLVASDRAAGRIEKMLSKIDMAMTSGVKRARVEHFLRLIGRICPKGYVPVAVLRALAITATERWEKDVEMPSAKVIERLRTKNWAADVPLVEKYMPIIVSAVQKIWKA